MGTGEEFRLAREALLALGYTEEAICRHLGFERISQFELNPERRPARPAAPGPRSPLDLMVRLFMEGERIDVSATAGLSLEPLARLGLIATAGGAIAATVMLYPMHGVYIVSDRTTPLEKTSDRPPEDFVYPAIVPNTALFLDLIQPGPCDAFLDLCAGTGIAALLAARAGARHAYSFDITGRSTVFAEFNRRLNAIDNVTAAEGDLYQPAEELVPSAAQSRDFGPLTFDRIVAHPPYVPVYRPQMIFDSGGQDGEQIVRRIIEGLPRYLRPGGRFFSLTMGSDRDQPFERRIREWLGPQEAEFDVAFVNRRTLTPREWAAESVIRNRGPVQDIANWREFFDALHVKALVYGLVMIQRRDQPRAVFTVRRQTGPKTGPAEHHWLLDWETIAAAPAPKWALRACPRAVPGVQLRIEHHLENGDWTPDAYIIETDHPFANELRAQAWTAYLLTCAGGALTVPELLEKMKSDGALHPDTPLADFAEMIATLVSGGFLRV
jgi:SAM-dependent methyltransferase